MRVFPEIKLHCIDDNPLCSDQTHRKVTDWVTLECDPNQTAKEWTLQPKVNASALKALMRGHACLKNYHILNALKPESCLRVTTRVSSSNMARLPLYNVKALEPIITQVHVLNNYG